MRVLLELVKGPVSEDAPEGVLRLPVLTADELEDAQKRGPCVPCTWTLKSSGAKNWLELGVSVSDALGYVIMPDVIDLEDDEEDEDSGSAAWKKAFAEQAAYDLEKVHGRSAQSDLMTALVSEIRHEMNRQAAKEALGLLDEGLDDEVRARLHAILQERQEPTDEDVEWAKRVVAKEQKGQ